MTNCLTDAYSLRANLNYVDEGCLKAIQDVPNVELQTTFLFSMVNRKGKFLGAYIKPELRDYVYQLASDKSNKLTVTQALEQIILEHKEKSEKPKKAEVKV